MGIRPRKVCAGVKLLAFPINVSTEQRPESGFEPSAVELPWGAIVCHS
jgi:hypothetical protein